MLMISKYPHKQFDHPLFRQNRREILLPSGVHRLLMRDHIITIKLQYCNACFLIL